MGEPFGYVTVAVWGVPNASKRGTKSSKPHKWAGCQANCAFLGIPNRSQWGTKSDVAHR